MGILKTPNKNLDAISLDEGIIYYTKDESIINEIATRVFKSNGLIKKEEKIDNYNDNLSKIVIETKNFFPKTIAEIFTQHNSKGKYSITIYGSILPYSKNVQNIAEDVLLNFKGFDNLNTYQ